MGLFDYVELPKEFADRLGRYGAELYQTKYRVENEYLMVCNGLTDYQICWFSSIFITLHVQPKSMDIVYREPILNKIKLNELGVIHDVKVDTNLYMDIYNRDLLIILLNKLGFKDFQRRKDESLESISENIASLNFKSPVEISVNRVEDKSSNLGFKNVIRLKSSEYEVYFDPDITIEFTGGKLTVKRRSLTMRKYVINECYRDIELNGIPIHVKFSLSQSSINKHRLDIEAEYTLKPDNIKEEDIDLVKNYIKDLVRKLVCSDL
jgi:hypothetical protein